MYFIKGIKFVSKISINKKKYLCLLKNCFIKLFIIILTIATNITSRFFVPWLSLKLKIRAFYFTNYLTTTDIVYLLLYFFLTLV